MMSATTVYVSSSLRYYFELDTLNFK